MYTLNGFNIVPLIGTGFVENASATLYPEVGLICIRCTFAGGEYLSRGCLSQIVNNDSGDVVGSIFVPKTEHKVSQNCEDAPQSAGSYRAVVYDTDSSGSIVGKHPLFVLDSAFVIHTPAGPLATLQTTSFGK